MTDQLRPGSYPLSKPGATAPPPPPPPPLGGYYPPPQAAHGNPSPLPPGPSLPPEAYASWGSRVVARLIDTVPVMLLLGIGVGVLLGTQETACLTDTSEYSLGEFCATGASTIGQVSIAVTTILALTFGIWNLGYRQGTTGSSIGQTIMKFRLVNETTGKPVGFAMALLREIMYGVAGGLCFGVLYLIAVLFPLWDPKRQTLVDKMLKHVALPMNS